MDSQNAMIALNAMCTRWEANGLALGWVNVTAVDGTMPSPDEAEESIAYNLAVRLGVEYPVPDNWDEIKAQAQTGLMELRRDRMVEMPLILKNDLPIAQNGGRWNIYTDEPVR